MSGISTFDGSGYHRRVAVLQQLLSERVVAYNKLFAEGGNITAPMMKIARESAALQEQLRALMSTEGIPNDLANESAPDVTSSKRFATPAKPRGRPKCSVHGTFMEYDAATDNMRCRQEGCEKSRRRNILFSTYDVGGETPPTVYRGRIELSLGSDDRLYLYLRDVNVMVDVESWLHNIEGKD